MNNNNENPFTKPSKRIAILISITWIAGVVLLVSGMTDLFTEGFFQKKYLMSYFLLVCSTIVLITTWVRHLRK